jgi:hypothetical protein
VICVGQLSLLNLPCSALVCRYTLYCMRFESRLARYLLLDVPVDTRLTTSRTMLQAIKRGVWGDTLGGASPLGGFGGVRGPAGTLSSCFPPLGSNRSYGPGGAAPPHSAGGSSRRPSAWRRHNSSSCHPAIPQNNCVWLKSPEGGSPRGGFPVVVHNLKPRLWLPATAGALDACTCAGLQASLLTLLTPKEG